jgi:hypothetical protein
MNEPVCGDCWRREHLTFVQRLDPAYNRRAVRHLCPEHRAQRAELGLDAGCPRSQDRAA